jgi:hypothetical protein
MTAVATIDATAELVTLVRELRRLMQLPTPPADAGTVEQTVQSIAAAAAQAASSQKKPDADAPGTGSRVARAAAAISAAAAASSSPKRSAAANDEGKRKKAAAATPGAASSSSPPVGKVLAGGKVIGAADRGFAAREAEMKGHTDDMEAPCALDDKPSTTWGALVADSHMQATFPERLSAALLVARRLKAVHFGPARLLMEPNATMPATPLATPIYLLESDLCALCGREPIVAAELARTTAARERRAQEATDAATAKDDRLSRLRDRAAAQKKLRAGAAARGPGVRIATTSGQEVIEEVIEEVVEEVEEVEEESEDDDNVEPPTLDDDDYGPPPPPPESDEDEDPPPPPPDSDEDDDGGDPPPPPPPGDDEEDEDALPPPPPPGDDEDGDPPPPPPE